MNTKDTTTAVQAIYRDLAERPIERACVQRTECCHFKLTGRTPFLTKVSMNECGSPGGMKMV